MVAMQPVHITLLAAAAVRAALAAMLQPIPWLGMAVQHQHLLFLDQRFITLEAVVARHTPIQQAPMD